MSLRRALALFCYALACWPGLAIAQDGAPAGSLPSFGGLLLQVVISLSLVCALAWAALRFGLARWLAPQPRGDAPLESISALPLGPRRKLHLVRALDRLLVIADAEGGARLICDMGPGSAQAMEQDPQGTFDQAMARAAAASKNDKEPGEPL